jgi:SAM-dependent methyltransferase
LTQASRILEIGASYSPIAPKAAGWRTHVVDHAPQEELRRKYSALGVDAAPIERVDTVWHGGPLHEAVPAALAGQFDAVIASHVIEHIPDLIGFLASAERLLAPSGAIVLAVPDQRYCFDYFKPLTTTGDILEAHAARRTRHARHTAWNHVAYSVTMDGRGAWSQEPVHDIRFADTFAAALRTNEAFRDDPDAAYADFHVWHLTPSRFRLVVLELGQMSRADWRIDELAAPPGAEFLCRLTRGAERLDNEAELQARRMALLREGLVEAQHQIAWATGSPARMPFAAGRAWGALSMLHGDAS